MTKRTQPDWTEQCDYAIASLQSALGTGGNLLNALSHLRDALCRVRNAIEVLDACGLEDAE